jgi:hypothetical protein
MQNTPKSQKKVATHSNSQQKHSRESINISEALSVGWELFKNNILTSILLTTVPIVLQFIPFIGPILNLLIAPGIIYAFVKLYDKKSISLNDIFAKINKVLPYLGLQIIIMFILMGGSLFLIIPGIIAQLALFFAIFLLIDQDMSIMESIRTSWTITKGYRGQLFLFFLIIGLVAMIVTVITLGIGLLIIIPVMYFASFHIYRNLLAQAKKTNVIPIDKLQTWPKVFLWVGIILLPLVIFATITLIALGTALEREQENYQNKMGQYESTEGELPSDTINDSLSK